MSAKKKTSRDKRIKVDVWVSEGLRLAIGAIMRDDGKPANDPQVRLWMQEQVDDLSVEVVDLHQKIGTGLNEHTVVWRTD
jgi:hypothetical protein